MKEYNKPYIKEEKIEILDVIATSFNLNSTYADEEDPLGLLPPS